MPTPIVETGAVLILNWKDATEPSRGTFIFAAGDVVADLAIGNGQLLRGKNFRLSPIIYPFLHVNEGHNCVWYNQLPSWVTSGNFDNATLQSIVETHCSTVVSHYAGKM